MEVSAVRIDDERLPRHIAIVMDGNGRWAKKRFLPRTAGHRAGVTSVRKVIEHCLKRRIEALTLFAFSSENWRRPPQEVSLLMELFLATLERETEKLHENGVRLRVIGDRVAFSPALQEKIAAGERLTSENTHLNLTIAANYGGRWDILQATRALAEKVARGELCPEDIGPDAFKLQLTLADLPEPDLFIRTGGEQRISNFLLWQLAYTELYFTPALWPDFDDQSLDQALKDYASRQRRFGYTSEQVEDLVSENVCTKTSEFR
ncbi:polyprenyl diphosphate synthase [Methylocaldum sp.]|uniref:polyprenyl diphosphate synthase n=1 Tax=Methylocaldum sp. TaxID=1969727 RepID=UPI002D34C9CF|nr:polyprenyl diphosphate synthase [Methylocaldum sp.]HYE36967.1 polyprenyl diphosphate synthase [Methylocaldum sp.]